MTVGITLEELLAWNEQSSDFWKSHLDANPKLLESALRHRRSSHRSGIRSPHLGRGTALGAAPRRHARDASRANPRWSPRCALRRSLPGRRNLPQAPRSS